MTNKTYDTLRLIALIAEQHIKDTYRHLLEKGEFSHGHDE